MGKLILFILFFCLLAVKIFDIGEYDFSWWIINGVLISGLIQDQIDILYKKNLARKMTKKFNR